MRRFALLDRDQAACALAVIALATLACLSPVHNDTWWHLAYGREMALSGGFAQSDAFSHTAAGRAFPNHQWLGERIMFALWRLGGLPTLTSFCAGLLVAAWILAWRLTRGPTPDRLLIMAAAVASSTLIWSIRPQVFTVLLLPLVVTLLARDRIAWLPMVVLLWSNLHGGVLLGLMAVAVWTAVAILTRREGFVRLGVVGLVCVVATLGTPLGLGYWPAVLRSLRRSQSHQLQEWQTPALPPEHLFFWAAVVAVLVLCALRWRTLKAYDDRGIVATALALLPSASGSLRNIPPFMMLAAAALTRLLFVPTERTRGAKSRVASGLVLAAAVAGVAVVALAWSAPWPVLQWTPLTDADITAVRGCRGPIYNTYAEGGPLIWFVPGQPVFVDSRQDPFPEGLVADATRVENGADPLPLLARYDVKCAVLPLTSPTASALAGSGWRLSYRSPRMAIYERPEAQPR